MKRLRERSCAIVLAMVMTMSLCVIPVAAEELTDEENNLSGVFEDSVESSFHTERDLPDTPEESTQVPEVVQTREAESVNVTPSLEDFEIIGTRLKGLKESYINGLTAEQKQNIHLIIPESVTAIETKAFHYDSGFNKGCRYVSLDFTQAKKLESIGTYAFCNNGVGFTGELSLPDSITEVGGSAFYGQKGITSVRLSSNITILDGQVFKDCTSLKTVIFPESGKLGTLKGNIFSYSAIEHIELPAGVVIPSSGTSGPFQACSSLKSIICANKADYDRLKKDSPGMSNLDKLTYPITVVFEDGLGGTYPALERAYNRPLNLIKNADGAWELDREFQLPPTPAGADGTNYIWSFTQGTGSKVTAESNAIGSTLYAIVAIAAPTIIFGADINKVYDAEPAFMTVTASHPLAKPISEAKAGDVVFYYTWQWAVIGGSKPESAFDKNSYEVKSVVVAPTDGYPDGYETSCMVKVQSCVVNDQNKAVVFDTQTHQFGVYIRPATPKVTPVLVPDETMENGLPKLKISDGDTPGEIAWDDGQQAQDGERQYTWTFWPTDANNYKKLSGSITYGKQPPSGSSGGGSTTPPPKTETDKKTEGDVTTETTTTTTTKKDGSKTTETKLTSTNAATGEKTEVEAMETVAKDGSVTKEETRVTTTADGAKTEEKTTATMDAKTGTSATTTVKTDASGKSTAAIVVENRKNAKEVTVSAAAVKSAARAEAATMTVRTGGVEITLDASAIAAVAGAKGETVAISVETVKTEALPEAAKEALKNAVVVDLGISVGDTKVLSFNGGTATVAVPYTKVDSGKSVVVYYVANDGAVTRVPGAIYDAVAKRVVFSTGHFSYYAVKEEAPLAFTDVSDADWYYEAVRYVTEAQFFHGTSATTFGPTGTMTREMLATVLYRKAGSPTSDDMGLSRFADGARVSEWAKSAMCWAVHEGVLTGVSEETLDPQGAVTRQQLAVILYRAAGNPATSATALRAFNDSASVADWAENGMSWAVEKGVVTGRGNALLDPTGIATRSEVAAMLMRIA